jgi:preprotein translocase subunit SecB
LNPVNFEALYYQGKEQAEKSATAEVPAAGNEQKVTH